MRRGTGGHFFPSGGDEERRSLDSSFQLALIEDATFGRKIGKRTPKLWPRLKQYKPQDFRGDYGIGL